MKSEGEDSLNPRHPHLTSPFKGEEYVGKIFARRYKQPQLERGIHMTLIRAFGKVDEEGKIAIPANIRTQAKLKPGQLVEIKLTGAGKAKNLVVSQRGSFR